MTQSVRDSIASQLHTYTELGYFEAAELDIDTVGTRLLERAEVQMIADHPEQNVLVTVPESMVSLEKRLALTGNRAFLPSAEMHNRTTWSVEPTQPYLLVDLQLGHDIMHMTAREARSDLIALGRTGLRLSELVDFSVSYRDAFDYRAGLRGYYAVETLHELNGTTTIVDLYEHGENLKVKRDPDHIPDDHWTTPSYAMRILSEDIN